MLKDNFQNRRTHTMHAYESFVNPWVCEYILNKWTQASHTSWIQSEEPEPFFFFFRTVLVSTPCRQVGSREGVYMDERVAEDKKPKEPKNRPSTRGGGRREETTIAQQRRRRRRTDDGRRLQKQQQQHDNLQQQLMQSAASLAPATTLWKRNVNSTINNSNESKQQKWTKIFTQKPPQNPQLNKGNKTFFFYCYAATKITIGQRRNFFFLQVLHMHKGRGGGARVSTWSVPLFLTSHVCDE